MDILHVVAVLMFVGLIVSYVIDVAEHLTIRMKIQQKLKGIKIDDKKRTKVKNCILYGDLALICEILGILFMFGLPQIGIGYRFIDDIYFSLCILIVYVASELILAYLYRSLNKSVRWYDGDPNVTEPPM